MRHAGRPGSEPRSSHKEQMMKRILLALSASCLAAAVPLQASAEPPAVYSVKDIVVGTMIPQAVITSAVPFDKTYAQMSAEQKAVLAQDYESLAPGDEPPYPALGLGHVSSYMVRFAEMTDVTGPLVATVEVSPEGKARNVAVYRSPDPRLTSMVTTLLANESYKPGKCGGAPCAMSYVMRVDFPSRVAQPVSTHLPREYLTSKGHI
jgi:hypothetical protein